jgi:hypothetical protein
MHKRGDEPSGHPRREVSLASRPHGSSARLKTRPAAGLKTYRLRPPAMLISVLKQTGSR